MQILQINAVSGKKAYTQDRSRFISLCFRYLSKSQFLPGALHRTKFAIFCHELMQNFLS